MSFETEFPSLSKHCIKIKDFARADKRAFVGYTERDIEENCLDKVRVKEAFKNLTEEQFCSWIYSELGLSDER